MRLESARSLKQELLESIVAPFAAQASRIAREGAAAIAVPAATHHIPDTNPSFGIGARPFETVPRLQRSFALGVTRFNRQYRLAIRLQRPGLVGSVMMERMVRAARKEVDVRIIGRIDKRPARQRGLTSRSPRVVPFAPTPPWYQLDARPLQIGVSVGHVNITAGTLGAFVKHGNVVCILSNNHVLANEDRAREGDWILQRAAFDGGKEPAERVARLKSWLHLDPRNANVVDAALAEVQPGIALDQSTLRDLVSGVSRKLAGVGPAFVNTGETVYKMGRTTGATRGRVTAFDVDNVIVNYDAGNLRFDNQIEIEGTGTRSFSDGGDSGSLIVNADMRAVGLLFAGGDMGGSNGMGLTFANPFQSVLSLLGASLLF